MSDSKISSLRLLRALFNNLDEYHNKQLVELKEYYEKSNHEHDSYVKKAQASMDAMGDEYDYHNYDYGVDQELAYEELAAESSLKFYNETANQQLLSIYEMKTLYLYKEVEIRLKTIISNEYNKSTSKLSNLKLIGEYFNKQNVNLEKIEGYGEIDELRLVANDLKHSIKINKSRSIQEFRGMSEFAVEPLEKFMSGKLYEVEMFLTRVLLEVNGKRFEDNSDIPF